MGTLDSCTHVAMLIRTVPHRGMPECGLPLHDREGRGMDGACCKESIGAAEVQAWIAKCRDRPVLPRPSRPETLRDLLLRIDRPGFVAEITCEDFNGLGRLDQVLWKSVLAIVTSDPHVEAIRVCWLDPARRAGFGCRVELEEVGEISPDQSAASPDAVGRPDPELS
jgi:hypothetical protein